MFPIFIKIMTTLITVVLIGSSAFGLYALVFKPWRKKSLAAARYRDLFTLPDACYLCSKPLRRDGEDCFDVEKKRWYHKECAVSLVT